MVNYKRRCFAGQACNISLRVFTFHRIGRSFVFLGREAVLLQQIMTEYGIIHHRNLPSIPICELLPILPENHKYNLGSIPAQGLVWHRHWETKEDG